MTDNVTKRSQNISGLNNPVELDWTGVFKSPLSSPIYSRKMHAVCPVPVAILKAIEVEVGATTSREVSIRFERAVESEP